MGFHFVQKAPARALVFDRFGLPHQGFMKQIKKLLDPNGIMNPGKIFQ